MIRDWLGVPLIILAVPMSGSAATRYVATTGSDSGTCTNVAAPCLTIAYGISQMSGGDTLIVRNGTYKTTQGGATNKILNVPNGNAGPDGIPGTADDVYTTVRAETDFGALLDGSNWATKSYSGVYLYQGSYVQIQGFRIHANPGPTGNSLDIDNTGIRIEGGHHVKVIRCGAGYTSLDSYNTASISIGPFSSYVLVEECYSFGGGRYQFLVYQSDHVVLRRNVARNDYANTVIQSSAYDNYDSLYTVLENNIAINSHYSCCSGSNTLHSGFSDDFHGDFASATPSTYLGNIVLDYKVAGYAGPGGINQSEAAGARVLADNIIWDSNAGFFAGQGSYAGQTAPVFTVNRMTSGAQGGTYSDGSGESYGVGMALDLDLTNTVTNSLFANNSSYGVIGYVNGDYNAYYGNGTSNYGGSHVPTPGQHDITTHNPIYNATANPTGSIKYLPRGAEPGSVLATAGSDGGPVGAQVLWKIGVDGTLWGQPGYDTVRSPANGYGGTLDSLWPFPNEAVIKSDLAAFSDAYGRGLPGARGFCASGNGLYGGPITLTSYIWEYLGNACPAEVCSASVGNVPAPPASLSAILM